ncbi:MAG: hypothetical protein QQN63_01545 [Nitrosopumilus sp.]
MDGDKIIPINVDGVSERTIVVGVDRNVSLASRVIDACTKIIGPGRLEIDTRKTYKWITDKEKDRTTRLL